MFSKTQVAVDGKAAGNAFFSTIHNNYRLVEPVTDFKLLIPSRGHYCYNSDVHDCEPAQLVKSDCPLQNSSFSVCTELH